ncbi:MAG TPA: VanZ family protein [Steroidobacteraceae bacterium]
MTGPAFRRAWIAAIVLLLAAIVATSLLPLSTVMTERGSDKLAHFTAYFLLALAGSGIVDGKRMWRVALRCVLLGLGLEVAQALWTETRQGSWADMAANAVGILCAWLIAGGERAGWARHVESWFLRRAGR